MLKKTKYRYQRQKGRNNHGKITSRHRGGGHSRLYRHVEFQKIKINVLGRVQKIEYDPYRSAKIAEIVYKDGSKIYKVSPLNLKIGDSLLASFVAPLTVGNTLPLKNIPLGTKISNIEPVPGRGSKFVRAGGTSALLMSKFGQWAVVRLPSKQIRFFSQYCWATIGQISINNIPQLKKRRSKAGRSRWLGVRPKVRGSAKNPVDHPHGGGEGKTPIGRSHPVTPWGKPTLGKRTRRSKKYSDSLIIK
nr:50S ribosomal protein L2 [Poropsis sp. ID1_4]